MPKLDLAIERPASDEMPDASYDLNETVAPIGGGIGNSEARFSDMVEPVTGSLVNIKAQKSQSILSRFMLDRHKRAAKTLGYVLTMADPIKWAETARIWKVRLQPEELYDLARSVLLALRPEEIEALFADVMGGGDYPLPSLVDPPDDVRPDIEKENPEAMTGATGAEQVLEKTFRECFYANLSPTMALCLAIVKCPEHDASLILEMALSNLKHGAPIPALFNATDEAAFWADFATPGELKAYALACYFRMSAKDQTAFRSKLGGRRHEGN